ncbi:MAG: hypothetical protein ACKV1O_30230 [Saprospiraceae bacterium]
MGNFDPAGYEGLSQTEIRHSRTRGMGQQQRIKAHFKVVAEAISVCSEISRTSSKGNVENFPVSRMSEKRSFALESIAVFNPIFTLFYEVATATKSSRTKNTRSMGIRLGAVAAF